MWDIGAYDGLLSNSNNAFFLDKMYSLPMKIRILSLVLSLCLFSACTQKPTAVAIPNVMYEAEVIQVGGVGSHSVTKSAWSGPNVGDTANYDATNLAITDFNAGGDLMWVRCMDGFHITKCNSSINNVHSDSDFGCGLEIENKLQNIVNIECIRSE